ncbi:Trypsin, putative [Coleofasciculus chthonoplastes PCC 7420]|uniref:Trypsin, putative n=1 Tax=Coleofasciculus chthonoplastes PCC 7420 TaxID=118168 RepID=B4W0Q0_9CYAN|nr:trypsin-like serine protease [Coleofasciculus chthonoplastes]EDX72177.1 Trypsin, putative [Coleofasciculus chthonoplastes PCC 7420]
MSILNKSSITGAGLALTILGTGGTAHAIVVYDESVNALVEPFDFTGVAFLETGSSFCSGSLLTGGLHILTAAHCFMNQNGQFDLNVVGQTRAIFNLSNESLFTNQPIFEAIAVSDFFIFPGFDLRFSIEGDLAILKLSKPASSRIDQYDIYRKTDEIAQNFTIVGYGDTGIGSEGFDPELFDGRKRFGQNQFDAFIDVFQGASQLPEEYFPKNTTSQLLFDFDNGNPENDAFGVHFGIHDLGLGNQEVSPGPGDSGGPSFLLDDEGNKLIAGITSFGFSDVWDTDEDRIIDIPLFPDNPITDVVIEGVANASFGEFAGVTRVSTYASFIDDVVAGKVRPTASVPEPSSILGTFILGTWGASTLLRRKNKQ